MKKPLPFVWGLEGTIMIFSLFIILGGTLVLVAWAQMMATRATYTVMTEEGQKRRIAMANGRALARQYVLNQMPASNSFLGTNYTLADGWGGFELQVPPDNPWTTTNFAVGNPFNPISGVSFVVNLSGSSTKIFNSVETNNWTFLIRSRSPLLAGYPITVHNPGTTNLAWATNANKIYWSNALGFSNAPDIPFTSGYTASGSGSTNAYLGYFASPMNTNYAYTDASGLSITNGNTNGGITNGTTFGTNTNTVITNYHGGSVTLVLNSTQTNAITRYVVPNTVTNVWLGYSNRVGSTNYLCYFSNSAVTNLMLVGATNTNTLHLIANSTNTNLNTLSLSGTNNTRRVYLNKVGGSSLSLTNSQSGTYTNNYTWWLGMTLSNCTATVYTPTTSGKRLTLEGGIRSDGTINQNGQGNLTITTNSTPAISGTNMAPIETIADRIMWLEEQRTP